MSETTLRLTTAQAIVRWLANQFIEIDGEEHRLCGGGFGIFGHGNVTCLGEALYEHRDVLPLYRGQNEQSMGFAAAGYAKAWLRRRFSNAGLISEAMLGSPEELADEDDDAAIAEGAD